MLICFHILKTGVYIVYIFLIIQNMDCEYSLDLSQLVPTINVLSKNKKNKKYSTECFHFLQHKKNLYIAWATFGRVFIMRILEPHHGKPTICICENKGADQLRGNREADQHLCFRYTYSTLPLLKSEISSF